MFVCCSVGKKQNKFYTKRERKRVGVCMYVIMTYCYTGRNIVIIVVVMSYSTKNQQYERNNNNNKNLIKYENIC